MVRRECHNFNKHIHQLSHVVLVIISLFYSEDNKLSWTSSSFHFFSTLKRNNLCLPIFLGSGSGAVGRAVASNTRTPQFESLHCLIIYLLTWQLHDLEKTKFKKKGSGSARLKININLCLSSNLFFWETFSFLWFTTPVMSPLRSLLGTLQSLMYKYHASSNLQGRRQRHWLA